MLRLTGAHPRCLASRQPTARLSRISSLGSCVGEEGIEPSRVTGFESAAYAVLLPAQRTRRALLLPGSKCATRDSNPCSPD